MREKALREMSRFNWKWFLVTVLLLGWSLTAYVLAITLLDERVRFASRNDIDMFIEFSAASGVSIKQIAYDLNNTSTAVAVCIGDLNRAEEFLNDASKQELLNDEYFKRFDSDDNIARFIVIYSNQNYRIFYWRYLSISTLDTSSGCLPIDDLSLKVTPPSIIGGKPKFGEVR